jgi:Domain of unknown function (DUF4136)
MRHIVAGGGGGRRREGGQMQSGYRRTRHRLATIAACVAVAAATGVAAKVKIHAQWDKTFAFGTIQTWAWHPNGAGDIRMAVSQYDNPEAMKKQYEPVIVDAVAKAMQARGLAQAAPGQTPDVYAHYYVLISVGQNRQVMGQFVPPYAAWALPPFAGATQSLKIVPEGSLVLDISNSANNDPIWRGIAEAEIDRQRSDAEREKRLREAIADMIKKFPRK